MIVKLSNLCFKFGPTGPMSSIHGKLDYILLDRVYGCYGVLDAEV